MTLEEKRAYVEQNIKFLPESEKKIFDFNFACVFTKNSVGMESGKTCKLEEVVSTVKGLNLSSLDEGLKRDIYNHYNSFLKIQDYVKENNDGLITEDLIKNIHIVLVNGVFQGGLYRNVNISVNGSRHTPYDWVKVYDKMHKYVDDVNAMTDDIDRACYTHLQLAKIHPFLDYNGRLCRLMLNYMLISHGWLPISIPAKRRNEYFATLELYKVEKTAEPFKKFLTELLNLEYDRLIELIEPFVK